MVEDTAVMESSSVVKRSPSFLVLSLVVMIAVITLATIVLDRSHSIFHFTLCSRLKIWSYTTLVPDYY